MTDKVPFGQALRRLLKDKENSISTHPTVGELVAYHDGRLPEEPSESLRDHVAICSACAKTLLELAAPSEPEGMTSDAHRRELWDDLQSRLREDGGGETIEDSTDNEADPPSLNRALVGGGAGDLTETPSHLRRLFAFRTIILCGACLVLLVWGAWLQLKVWDLTQPHVVDRVAGLQADQNAGVRGGESGLATVSAGGRNLILLSLFDGRGYAHFRIEIFADAEGGRSSLWTSDEVQRLDDGSLVLDVPPHFLKPGTHTIRLYGVSGEVESLVAEYSLRVD